MNNQELINIVSQAISDEPEFPGAPPEGLMQALMSGDKNTIISALRLTVALTKIGITERINERISKNKRISKIII